VTQSQREALQVLGTAGQLLDAGANSGDPSVIARWKFFGDNGLQTRDDVIVDNARTVNT
jgi:hypothetical protein